MMFVPFRPTALGLALLLAGGTARADQTREQQRCLTDLYKRAGSVVMAQHRADHVCLKRTARAKPCAAEGGKRLDRQIGKLIAADANRCVGDGVQPDFGYRPGPDMAAAAATEAAALAETLFGPGLAAAVLLTDDRDGARCQAAVLKRTGKLLDRLWREARLGAGDALDGSVRTWGPNPVGPLDDAFELEAEMRVRVAADTKGRITKAADALARDVERKCATTGTALTDLVPGCAATTPTDLASCATALAARTLHRARAAALALDVSCDLTDDGVANESCVPRALAQHVLGRLGYDPDAWTLARLEALGPTAYIEEQLDPASIAEDPALDAILAGLPSLTMDFRELRANYVRNPAEGELGLGVVQNELEAAKAARAILSRRQLAQVLDDFWFNHFNVATNSRRIRYDVSPYERITIRPNVLGRFRDLLLAVARSPAMGDFLDNRRSKVNDLNENYSREFMELHTVGVSGGYTETDVVEVARCFTGWREDYDAPDGFRFQENWHDQGAKSILGGALLISPNGGEQDGIDVVDFFASREATARHLATKLIVRLVSETPPAALVDAAAATYLASGGDLRETLRTILLSPEFLEWPYVRQSKVKRPFHLMASLARTTGTTVTPALLRTVVRRARDLGEELYEAGSPAGYPDVSPFWASPGALVVRFNEIERAARRRRNFDFAYPVLGPSSAEIVDGLVAHFFVAPASSDTRDVAVAFLDVLPEPDHEARTEQAAAVLLASPEFLQH